MDITIPEIIQERTIFFGVGLTVTLIGFAIKAVTGLISFYEDVIIKRYFKRLTSLSEHIKSDSTVYQYLNYLKDNEIFRLASGIEASPEKSSMLMKVYLLGVASTGELKRLSRYLKPKDMKASIEVNFIDKAQFTYSFFAAMFLLVTGVLMGSPYFVIGKGVESLAGLLVMIFFTFIAAIVGRDYRTYRILKRVRERLIEHDMVANPDKSIQWNFHHWPRRS